MAPDQKKEEFEEYAHEKGVNAIFTGRLDYTDMCAFLSFVDVVVNPICKKSAASIINKHADYASCGKPVINTQDSVEYRQLVDSFKMGINCRPGDIGDVCKAIDLFFFNKTLTAEYGVNSRKCAEELFDRQKTYKTILDLILE